jgi:hypothetical protein
VAHPAHRHIPGGVTGPHAAPAAPAARKQRRREWKLGWLGSHLLQQLLDLACGSQGADPDVHCCRGGLEQSPVPVLSMQLALSDIDDAGMVTTIAAVCITA